MQKQFVFDHEPKPGAAWLARFVAGRVEAQNWYLGQGLAPPPSANDCRSALRLHMPELVPHYDRACSLVGDDDIAHRMLSHYRPPPAVFGCSQAVWLEADGPALVRNYDYPLDIVSDRFEMAEWFGRKVIAKAQRPWGGCLDGMNEDGLVASVTYGGSRAQGLGFSVILMVRYVLETCHRVEEAVKALCRIPIALSQNVTLLDRSGEYATVFLRPGRDPVISEIRACTNHQDSADAAAPEIANSIMRQQTLLAALAEPAMDLNALTELFLRPPIHSRQRRSPTVYTAVYRPAEGRVDYIWPGRRWRQGFDSFEQGRYTHDYGDLGA